MLDVTHISKSIGGRLIFEDLSFEVPRGCCLGILGINGAGKSTLLRILATLLSPDSGSIVLDGRQYTSNLMAVRGVVGYMPDEPPLYSYMSVKENLFFLGHLRSIDKETLKTRIERLVEQLDLNSVYLRPCASLSKGFRQRVSLAAALLAEPQLLLLDEPSSGLDPGQRELFLQLIRRVKPSTTIVMSSHTFHELHSIADSALLLGDGKGRYLPILSDLTQFREQFFSFLGGEGQL